MSAIVLDIYIKYCYLMAELIGTWYIIFTA